MALNNFEARAVARYRAMSAGRSPRRKRKRMKIKGIKFGKKGLPSKVNVEMTVEEAAYLARVTGKQSGITAEEHMPGGREVNSAVYNYLVADVFNPYWEAGVEEYIRSRDSK
jgi:hypothetical protein